MMMTFEHVTSVYNAGKPDEQTALKDVSLSFDTSRITGVCGVTGSGKSTFIRHLNGILKPVSGRVLIDGEDIHRSKQALAAIRRRIGMTFQFPERQFFGRTVWEELTYTLEQRGLPPAAIEERVVTACQRVNINIQELRERSPFALSRGEQRKLGIAVMVTLQPEVLVLDEPTAGMDRRNSAHLLSMLHTLHEEHGCQLLLVSHDIELLLQSAQLLILLEGGRVCFSGSPQELTRHPGQLDDCHLCLPPVSKTLAFLRETYPEVRTDVQSVDDAVAEVLKIKPYNIFRSAGVRKRSFRKRWS